MTLALTAAVFGTTFAGEPAPAPAPAITIAEAKISQEDAIEKALADAGLSQGDANVVKNQKEFEDDLGIEKYDIEFFGPDGMKYEYDISVADGTILDKEAEFDD